MKDSATITPLGAVALANAESARPGESTYLNNLREREGSLEVVGSYSTIANLAADEKLLVVHRSNSGTHIITSRGCNIYHRGTLIDGTFTAIDKIVAVADSAPISGHSIGCWAVINTAEGSIYLLLSSDGYRLIDHKAIQPTIMLHSTEATTERRQIEAIEFGGPYASWSALASTDLQRISSMVRASLRSISASAAQLGKFCGAVWARCGVRLADDSYLWLSAPVLVGIDEAKKCCQSISATATMSGSGVTGIGAFSPYLTAYRLGITPISSFDEGYDSLIKAVDILVSDPVPFYDTAGDFDYRCTTSTVTGSRTYALVVNAPMVQYEAAVMARLGECRWRVASSTTDFDALRQKQWVANNAPSSAVPLLSGYRTYALSYAQGTKTLDADALLRCLRCLGADVSHRHAVSDGNSLLHGGIDLIHRMPWSAAYYFSRDSLTAAACKVNIEITIATDTGNTVITRHEQLPFTPSAIAPAIFFPSARARGIAISIKGSGNTLKWQGTLMPLAQTEAAGCVTNRLTNNTLTDTGSTAFTPASSSTYRQRLAGSIMICTDGNPFAGKIITALHSDEITALAMVQKPLSSNSFGKYPIYIFGKCGTYALPQTIGGTYGESRLLSRTTICPATLPCEAFGAIYFVSSDYHLMALQGAVMVRKMRQCRASILAWNECEQELWLSLDDGSTCVLMASGRHYHRSESLRQAIAHQGNSVAVDSAGRMMIISHEVPDETRQVEWMSHPIIIHKVLGRGLRGVTWNIEGSCTGLNLQLSGQRGYYGHGFRVASVKIDGTPRHPVYMRTYAPILHSVRLSANGQFRSKSLILPVILHAKMEK